MILTRRWVTALCLATALAAGSGVAAASENLPARVATQAAAASTAAIPDRAWNTLKLIDARQWPPQDASGTKGGAVFANRDGVLAASDANGKPITYRVWDVNIKQPGKPRDAERIVTGDDGSAWYSSDHCRTFTQMR